MTGNTSSLHSLGRNVSTTSFCSHCLNSLLQQMPQHAAPLKSSPFIPKQRLYHSLMNSPATTAAEAPSLANLQGLLHVYKQSLDNVGSAVEQLRHTLVPFEAMEFHEEDPGRFAAQLRPSAKHTQCPVHHILERLPASTGCEAPPYSTACHMGYFSLAASVNSCSILHTAIPSANSWRQSCSNHM